MIFSTDVGGADLVQHDTTSAFYVDGGVFWRTGKRFNIGLGTRVMTLARGEIEGVRGDANYVQFHALAGFGWPRREKPRPGRDRKGLLQSRRSDPRRRLRANATRKRCLERARPGF